MKTRILIIIVIVIVIMGITMSQLLISPPLGSTHCPGLELRKSLGLVDPTAACL